MSRLVQVSPRHRVTLNDDFLGMMDTVPREDFVVQILAQRKVAALIVGQGELFLGW